MKRSTKKAPGRALLFLVLGAAALPVWWVLWFLALGALQSPEELAILYGPVLRDAPGLAGWTVLPSWPTLRPLAELLLDTPEFFAMFWNSCRLALPQLLGQLLVGAPAAWAFSRLRFFGRQALFGLYLLLMVLPFQVTMVPGYLVLGSLGLLDTRWAVVLPGVFSTFPVFIMAKSFDAVPRAMLEAARIDGAGPLQTFLRIGLPLGAPGVAAAAVLGFLDGWNLIEQPMTYLKSPSLWPLSIAMPGFSAASGLGGLALAASLVALVPAVLVFLCGQRYLELGIQSSGLKG